MPRPSFPIELARQLVEKEDYTLLGGGTKRGQKLFLLCPKDHEWKIAIDKFKAGTRCRQCFCESLVLSHEFVASEFAKEKYDLLDRYEKAKKKMRFKCSAGHIHAMSWDDFRSGYRCGICAGRYLTEEQVRFALGREDYKLLGEYISANKRMHVECDKGHKYFVTWANFYNGKRCPRCAGKMLTDEEKRLKKIRNKVNTNIRTAIANSFNALKRKGVIGITRPKDVSISSIAVQAAVYLYNTYGLKPKGWHIDHIVPSSFFDFTKAEEIETCWKPCNLRYLLAAPNIRRGNKLTIEEVCLFTEEQIEVLRQASKKPKRWEKYIENLDLEQQNAKFVQLKINLLAM